MAGMTLRMQRLTAGFSQIIIRQPMKTHYHKTLTFLCCLATAGLLASCYSTLSYNEAMQRNVSKITDSEKLEDARFLLEAASYNILATKMAEAAIESGYSASVVSMARENLGKHVEMERELRRLARREDVVLTAGMNSEHERILAELNTADRREFDRSYIRLLGELSREDRQKFSRMATDANSEHVRSFAARKLDLFESYEREIETVDADLLRTY